MNSEPLCIDAGWRLRFDAATAGAEPIDFPCDERGCVDLDALDDEQRQAYFCARVVHGLRRSPRVVRADDR